MKIVRAFHDGILRWMPTIMKYAPARIWFADSYRYFLAKMSIKMELFTLYCFFVWHLELNSAFLFLNFAMKTSGNKFIDEHVSLYWEFSIQNELGLSDVLDVLIYYLHDLNVQCSQRGRHEPKKGNIIFSRWKMNFNDDIHKKRFSEQWRYSYSIMLYLFVNTGNVWKRLARGSGTSTFRLRNLRGNMWKYDFFLKTSIKSRRISFSMNKYG